MKTIRYLISDINCVLLKILLFRGRRTDYGSLRPNEIVAMEQFKDVCRDFIVYKLNQHNLVDRYVTSYCSKHCQMVLSTIVTYTFLVTTQRF